MRKPKRKPSQWEWAGKHNMTPLHGHRPWFLAYAVLANVCAEVVLPILWERMREKMPPVVCINGGCSMGLPKPIHWPDSAVSFLLMGGQDVGAQGAAFSHR